MKKLFLFKLFFLSYNLFANQVQEHQFKAIIFDMDGTILNTEIVWVQANDYLLTTYAPDLNEHQKEEIIETFKRLPVHEGLKLLQTACSLTKEELIYHKTNYILDIYATQGISFIPFFPEFHEKISQLGVKTAIATNATQHVVNCILQQVPLKFYFGEHIYTVNHVNQAFKPKPDLYLHAAKMLGIEPQNCIAIEDSLNGIKAAKAAGMYCIGINTGKNHSNLEQADEIIECFSEIDIKKLFNLETTLIN